MSSTTDKIKGATNEAVGKAKQGIGKAVDSDKLKGEGAAQEVKGKVQTAVGNAKETATEEELTGEQSGHLGSASLQDLDDIVAQSPRCLSSIHFHTEEEDSQCDGC